MLVTHDARVAARADKVISLADGKVRAEYQLGKNNNNTQSVRQREDVLVDFLKEQGF